MHKRLRQIPLLLGFFGIYGSSFCLAQDYPLINTSSKLEAVNAALDAFDQAAPTIPSPDKAPSQSSDQQAESKLPSVSPVYPSYVMPSTAQSSSGDSNKIFQNVKVSGEVRSSVGIYGDGHAVFNRANGNLTERNYDLLTHDQLFRGENTYDPALFSRLKVVMDSTLNPVVSMHLNLTVDPWSYTGKTNTTTVSDTFNNDTAKVRYLFWGNTGYTLNQIVNTQEIGDAFAIPELKVHGNTVPATTVQATAFYPYVETFNIPSMKVDYTFQPIREAWFDIKPEQDATIRIFPLAYQDQALTSDDPLRLSNNMMWWAESPWIDDWQPGIFHSGGSPDFTKGYWDRSLAYATRDSDLQRLTALRGVSLSLKPDNDNILQAEIASPKTLWQDYDEITAVPASVRAKHYVDDMAYIGTVANAHQGYVSGQRDAENYTGGIDGGFLPVKWLMVDGEYSISRSRYDETTPAYTTKKNGNAYYASLTSTSNSEDMIRKDYFALAPALKTDDFYKTRLYFARMDENFESTLSQYHETRYDSFWSRNITFYPNTYRFLPGVIPSIGEESVTPFAIGNGIDYGRNVIGWRADTDLVQNKVHGLADFRRVMTTNNQHIETVARTQWSLQATDKLLTRALFLWHALPKTVQGVDPVVFNNDTGQFSVINTSVEGGKDPSVKTVSLGARYELTSWANINGVWDYTNDFTYATNYFPQGILNSSSFATYTQNGAVFRQTLPFLYTQQFFDQPPYRYHNIFKSGLELIPAKEWHIYLDYTINPNKFAGNIDDNMNHYGIETSFVPNKKIGFFARYTFSKWYDIDRLVYDNVLKYKGYNNLFFETRMVLPADSTLSLQYGVGPSYNVKTRYEDPNLNYYLNPTLSTQHVVRITCEKRF